MAISVPGEAEHALPDDVALDLRRARRDRQRQHPQALLHQLVVVEMQPVAAEYSQTQLAESLARLGIGELDHHRARAGSAALRLGHVALGERPERVELRSAPTQLASCGRVAHVRAEIGAQAPRVDQLAHERRPPFVFERDVRDAPAVVLAPTRLATGTRTSFKKTSQNSELPSTVWIGRISMPGAFMGRISHEMPLCFGASGSVRTRNSPTSAIWPNEHQIFWPFRT
jgi:hypothetical protein